MSDELSPWNNQARSLRDPGFAEMLRKDERGGMRYKLLREFHVAQKFAASGGLTYEEAGEFAGYDLEEDRMNPWLAVKDLVEAGFLVDSGDQRRLSTGVMHPVFRITRAGILALDRAVAVERALS